MQAVDHERLVASRKKERMLQKHQRDYRSLFDPGGGVGRQAGRPEFGGLVLCCIEADFAGGGPFCSSKIFKFLQDLQTSVVLSPLGIRTFAPLQIQILLLNIS